MKQSMSEKAAGSGGERRGKSPSGFGGDNPVGEYAGERRVIFPGGIGVDIDIEKIGWNVFKEQFPKRSKRKRGIREKHEGQFMSRRWGSVDTGGKWEEKIVILRRKFGRL